MIRVGINGFGRIGRSVFRILSDRPDMEVVAINDLYENDQLAYLLKYDTVMRVFEKEVSADADSITVAGRRIRMTEERDPSRLPWGELGVDVVVESTGVLVSREKLEPHLAAGARRVVLTVPPEGDVDAMIVMGVNDETLKPEHRLVSNASCTTNCLAPIAKILDERFGILEALMTTVHAYTNDQNVLDGPHKDPRRARSAAVNIIPTTTGAARAVAEVIPAVAGRLDGVALRVPVVDGSLVDLAVVLDAEVDAATVNAAFERAAATGPLAGRLQFSTDPLVSSDIIGNPASCVLDSGLTQAAGRFAKVFGWYDNEWGYTARLVDLTRLVAADSERNS